jgi:Zn-dependent M28 family amino/carboxypeptidase
VRAYKAAGGRPARDVIVLFTDGEERGLHGARLYFADSARARRVGVVLNFEARGGGGRAYMFETGPNNAALVEAFGRSVASPSASSLARFVYDRMPNGTDFTIPKRAGIAG